MPESNELKHWIDYRYDEIEPRCRDYRDLIYFESVRLAKASYNRSIDAALKRWRLAQTIFRRSRLAALARWRLRK